MSVISARFITDVPFPWLKKSSRPNCSLCRLLFFNLIILSPCKISYNIRINHVKARLSIGFSTKLIRVRHWVKISGICWQHSHYHYLVEYRTGTLTGPHIKIVYYYQSGGPQNGKADAVKSGGNFILERHHNDTEFI